MAIDMAVANLKRANGQMGKIHASMSQLIGMSDESARIIERSFTMVNLAVGVMEIGLAVQKMIDIATKEREVVKAGILTGANSWNPAGWGKIALATATSLAVGACIAVIMNSQHTNPAIEKKIKADLSSASSRTAVSQLVGVMA